MGTLSSTLLDSNIIIDAFNRIPAATQLVTSQPAPAISIMTWIEVLAGARTPSVENDVRQLLNTFEIVQLTGEVAEIALQLRRSTKLKLVDAIILACARATSRELITRNTKDFDPSWPGVTVPYHL